MVFRENVDYQIIQDKADEQALNVRVLRVPYTETVIKYGTVKFNEIPKNMSFDFTIVYTPDTELDVSDKSLQDFAGEMLEKYTDLRLVDYGFFYHKDESSNLDDITWFLMEKADI